jgi:hypothetical protein
MKSLVKPEAFFSVAIPFAAPPSQCFNGDGPPSRAVRGRVIPKGGRAGGGRGAACGPQIPPGAGAGARLRKRRPPSPPLPGWRRPRRRRPQPERRQTGRLSPSAQPSRAQRRAGAPPGARRAAWATTGPWGRARARVRPSRAFTAKTRLSIGWRSRRQASRGRSCGKVASRHTRYVARVPARWASSWPAWSACTTLRPSR